jgi:SAM-dependent methyltransferase
MSYYHDPKNVREYVQMAEGYDGRELVDVLTRLLPADATVLELGMGPGKDLDLLNETFRATGSDYARAFLDWYRSTHPQADLLELDAVTVDTDRRFDAIYSNKVLIHLTGDQLAASLGNQAKVLNPGGLLLHSLWYGKGEEGMQGLHFAYYTEDTFAELVGDAFEIVETARYTEMEEDDSFYVVLRLRPQRRTEPTECGGSQETQAEHHRL